MPVQITQKLMVPRLPLDLSAGTMLSILQASFARIRLC